MLVVERDGLRLAGKSAVPEPDIPFEPEKAPPRPSKPIRQPRGGGGGFGGFWNKVRQDKFSWMFGIGLCFVIIFLFFPLIDNFKSAGRSANLEEARIRQKRLTEKLKAQINKEEKSLQKRLDAAKDEDQKKTISDELTKKKTETWPKQLQARAEEELDWETGERLDLEERADSARFSARRWSWWYAWGMLIGFLLLAVGAMGYLRPEQTLIWRVVGAIIICAQALLIFFAYLIRSSVSAP
jgi:hypothetical protein